jgi:TetR/AcrR family transcriptional regulator, lmrAB and yxaGH operons repressor
LESGAPRGSLYYHFPGGKEELVLEATRQGVASVTQLLKEALTGSPDLAVGVRAFVEAAAHMLRDSRFVFGCPVAPIVLDSPESSALAKVCREALEEWQQVLVEALGSGIERRRAESLATVVVCALEGGLILARARRDIAPLESIADELASMVQSALPHFDAGVSGVNPREPPSHETGHDSKTVHGSRRRRESKPARDVWGA